MSKKQMSKQLLTSRMSQILILVFLFVVSACVAFFYHKNVRQLHTVSLSQDVNDSGDTQELSLHDREELLLSLSDHIHRITNESSAKSSIDRLEIENGGVGVDGIPAINNPQFASVRDSPDWLRDTGDGIMVERDGQARFYPYQVLVSHEIVNDDFSGERLIVTYCPLCFTGVVYDVTDSQYSSFGVSGYLWESNLLMYNRPRDTKKIDDVSLWSQALGEAVVGAYTGESLKVARFDITTYEKFRATHPQGEVLIGDRDQVFSDYTRIPYGGNLRDIDPFFRFSGEDDDRLEKTEIILGLIINEVAKAYPTQSVIEKIEQNGPFTDVVGGESIQVDYNDETGVIEFYSGELESANRLTPVPSFWISWVSLYPETEIYQ